MGKAAAERRAWEIDEVILALGLYVITPYSRITERNPRVRLLAAAIGRSAGAVSMKLGNLASCDKSVADSGRKGFGNLSAKDREAWARFTDPATGLVRTASLRDAVERIAASRGIPLGFLDAGEDEAGLPAAFRKSPPEAAPDAPAWVRIDGAERLVTRKERVHQDYFRRAVLANCGMRCAVTGCGPESLLEAAHILPWAEFPEERLEIGNGLALNVLLHAAYDRDLIGITADGVVKVSRELRAEEGGLRPLLDSIDGAAIGFSRLRRPPNPEFLSVRYERFRERVRRQGPFPRGKCPAWEGGS